MKTIILGSGVVGVTAAYYLAKAGIEVTIIERQPDAALETSFANAGEISGDHATPWAAPGIPWRAVRWLFDKHSPLVIRPRLDPAQWFWLLRMLRNCTRERFLVNKERMLRLARYSRTCLRTLREETGLRYDEGSRGILQLFRSRQELDEAAGSASLLERYGIPYVILDWDGCIQVEPGLKSARSRPVGGIHLPADETGDCFKFTRAVARLAAELGVRFEYRTRIRGLDTEGGRIRRVRTDRGDFSADNYIVSLGSYSPLLLRPLGIRLPIYPVKGYSVTLPITDDAAAPLSTLMDETHKVGVTRLGDRIRAAGTAELTGYDLSLRKSRLETIDYVVDDLFPHGGDLSQAEYWTGLRPMVPDGPPVLGPTRYPNLFVNTGHGTLGWTMACASGRVIADLLSGREPEISLEGLTVARYGQSVAPR